MALRKTSGTANGVERKPEGRKRRWMKFDFENGEKYCGDNCCVKVSEWESDFGENGYNQ
jgi:hypothetical protein